MDLCLRVLSDSYAISRLSQDVPIPVWAQGGEISAVVRTCDELSVVCLDALVPKNIRAEKGWRVLKVLGPLAFSLVGILANLTRVLADAEVSIFAISTFDTDYLLIKQHQLEAAKAALLQAGYSLQEE